MILGTGTNNMTYDIGIIGALSDEVAGLISLLCEHRTETVSGVDFHTGRLYGKNVVVAKCGVGKVFAAICAEAMAIKYAPSLIVNTGVGGALAKGLKTTDIVIAESLVQHDMDTSPIGDPVGLVSGINKIYFEADKRAVEILKESAESLSLNAVVGIVATGDRFIAEKKDKDRITELFGASACEMEGGAIAHTAFVNGINFAVIRAISDSADGEATMDYPTFMPIAVKSSTALTLELIKKY